MILFKDSRTGKKSLTITCLIITFLLSCITLCVNILNLYLGRATESSLVWASFGLCTPFIGLYWQKRVRASSTSIQLFEKKDVINANTD